MMKLAIFPQSRSWAALTLALPRGRRSRAAGNRARRPHRVAFAPAGSSGSRTSPAASRSPAATAPTWPSTPSGARRAIGSITSSSRSARPASGVSIEANKKDGNWREQDNNVVETEFDIQVPADVTLDIDVFSSDVIVKDVRGRQRLHTFSGEIDVTGADGALDAETFSGDIEVELAQGASASVDFDSFSGSLQEPTCR